MKPFPEVDMSLIERPDARYSVAYQWCGYSVPMIAVCFCDELLGMCRNELTANNVIAEHHKNRSTV